MAWADTGYDYKRKITIDNTKVAGDETDFPVLVSITDSNFADVAHGGHVESSNGYDICFYESTETTKLYHEIEKYTNTSGELVYWVNIPSISSTSDTIFYIYYGNGGISTDPSSTSTWDINYIAVYHMYDKTTSTIDDATSNSNDGTKASADNPLESTSGKIGNCQNCDGSTGDYISIGNIYGADKAQITWSLWANPDVITGDDGVIGTAGDAKPSIALYSSNWAHGCRVGGTAYLESSQAATTSGYQHIAVSYNDSDDTIRYYYNGSEYATDATGGGTISMNVSLILAEYYSTSYTYDGLLDEVRFSIIQRGANWILTEYNNQDSPSTFMSFGREQIGVIPMSLSLKMGCKGGLGRPPLGTGGASIGG